MALRPEELWANVVVANPVALDYLLTARTHQRLALDHNDIEALAHREASDILLRAAHAETHDPPPAYDSTHTS